VKQRGGTIPQTIYKVAEERGGLQQLWVSRRRIPCTTAKCRR